MKPELDNDWEQKSVTVNKHIQKCLACPHSASAGAQFIYYVPNLLSHSHVLGIVLSACHPVMQK